MDNRIVIVGDLFPVPSNFNKFAEGDVNYLFGEKICKIFGDADYRICNLEGALTDDLERCDKTGPIITAPTSVVNAYKALGIDYCMLANNHITDGGSKGVISTLKTLKEVGIKSIGAGLNCTSIPHHVILSIGDKRVGIYNVCETMYNKPTLQKAGAWIYDEYIVCKEIEQLKTECDYLIVIYHGGIEKFRYPSRETRKRFHRMADCGADVVLSQHTHCIGCEEYYNNTYLLYGQGDFLFNNFRPELTKYGLIIELIIDKTGLNVRKHQTKCLKSFSLQYIDKPDLSDFEERSKLLSDEEYVDGQFRLFCEQELRTYLLAFKSTGIGPGFFRRFLPTRFEKWLKTEAFSRRNLMFILHTLRSEQNRETAIVGLENLLKID